jgi:hypothetical protein
VGHYIMEIYITMVVRGASPATARRPACCAVGDPRGAAILISIGISFGGQIVATTRNRFNLQTRRVIEFMQLS